MDLRVGALDARVLRQIKIQISELYIIVLDFGIFALFLNYRAWNASGIENAAKFCTL